MTRSLIALAILSLAAPTVAQETRQLDAHEHGVSTAEIAIEDELLVIDLHAPGVDIVGFEYEAEADEDRAAVARAVMQLTRADEIVTVDDAAGCLLIEVLSHLHGEEHDHGETHAHMEGDEHGDEHGHDDEHDAEHGDEHGHDDEHDADHGDDGHGDDEHDHGDEVAGESGTHSEFHARYIYDCADTSAIATIDFPFFEAFENAVEIEAVFVTASGSGGGELERGDATLSLDEGL